MTAALFAMDPVHLPVLFPPPLLGRLAGLVDVPATAAPVPPASEEAEVLITGWGCTPLDAAVLRRLPRLRAVLHAAGSVKPLVTEACWERGLLMSSAAAANAVPVAEFTLGAILLAGKDTLRMRALYADRHAHPGPAETTHLGNHRRRVGIVGASRIGRRVIALLRPFDLDLAVHDPFLTERAAGELGIPALPLDELVARSDVLSLHAPALPETRHLMDGRRLALMPDGATLVNTARGSLVDTAALTAALVSGRISAVLDVTDPEPMPPGSPLYGLPNVLLTPHIAGALGNELERLGVVVVEELERLLAGAPLRYGVRRADLDHIA